MDASIAQALSTDRTVDITTIGRKTGQPRRIEIGLFALDKGYVLSGRPGRPRSWYANLRANPQFTVHLKKSVRADVPARAAPVLDQAERRVLFAEIFQRTPRLQATNIEEWMAGRPLLKVEILA